MNDNEKIIYEATPQYKVFWGQKKRDIDVCLLNRSYLIYTSELPSSHDLHAPYCRIVRLLRLGYPVAIALLSEQTEYESRYILAIIG